MSTRRLPKPFDDGELEALRRASADRPDVWALCVFLRETGLRSAEACAISSEQVRRWPVPGRIRNRRPRVKLRVIGKGKGGMANEGGGKERVVMLTPDALRAAHTLLGYSTNGHLVPWTDRGMRYLMAELGKKAGVHAHPHRFRHQFVTELVESGVPIEVVADMAGHSRTDITRLYWQASERAKLEALERRRRFLRRRH
jgi:integrase